jgi:hypothetical protein
VYAATSPQRLLMMAAAAAAAGATAELHWFQQGDYHAGQWLAAAQGLHHLAVVCSNKREW